MTTEADGPIRTEHRGAALWLWLNRPHALNSLTLQMVRGLHQGLALAAGPGVRVVVIAGKGRAFCAGADLTQVLGRVSGDAGPAAEDDFLQQVGAAFDRLEIFEKPVIAAVHGLAVAGGLELVLCCDLVVATRSASFGDAHANYGLLPARGGSRTLPPPHRPARAKHRMFAGGTV